MMNLDDFTYEQRKNGLSLQYNTKNNQEYPLSFWLSDMDIQPPKEFLDAILQQYSRSLGYSFVYKGYYDAIIDWYQKRYNALINEKQISYSPSVLYSLNAAVEILKIKTDEIAIFKPYYSGYKNLFDIEKMHVINLDSNWNIELNKIVNLKVIILCNPHNPTGKVVNEIALKKLINFCKSNNVWVFSDEIHADFSRVPFTPSVVTNYSKIVSFHSIGKSFNVSGVVGSYILSNNLELLEKFKKRLEKNGLSNPNTLNLRLTEVAYTSGVYWLDLVKKQVEDNIRYLRENLNCKYIFEDPDGIYSVWINYNNLQISELELKKELSRSKMKVMLGSKFGCNDTEKYFRLNIACDLEKLGLGVSILNAIAKIY
jgi:cystathionine beta-lyase